MVIFDTMKIIIIRYRPLPENWGEQQEIPLSISMKLRMNFTPTVVTESN